MAQAPFVAVGLAAEPPFGFLEPPQQRRLPCPDVRLEFQQIRKIWSDRTIVVCLRSDRLERET